MVFAMQRKCARGQHGGKQKSIMDHLEEYCQKQLLFCNKIRDFQLLKHTIFLSK